MGSFETSRVCTACHGTGKIPKHKCKACSGVGIKQIREDVVISIPAGIEDGEMLRMTGKGEAIVGGTTGDLYVKVRVKNHPLFERQGSNLLCAIEIKLSDALLGSEYPLKTLDGEISVTIPEGIRHGEMLRVKGKGVPMGSGKRGDIIITVSIMMPKKISKAARKTIEELRKEGL
jgi:molecular chaperone DnaJ